MTGGKGPGIQWEDDDADFGKTKPEPDEAERVRSALLGEANNHVSSKADGANQVKTGRARPLGASMVKEWIHKSAHSGGHDAHP